MHKPQESAEVLPVVGSGVLLDSTPFYVVPSQSDEGRSHLVQQLPMRLSCDCKAFHYRGRCIHVRSVVAHKQALQLAEADRAYKLARADVAETRRELQAINRTASAAATSARPERWGGRSQAAFSLLK